MNISGHGIMKDSTQYFHTPSQTALKTFFYPIAIGHYYCNTDYNVQRESYDSFLVLYLKSGTMTVFIRDNKFFLKAGDCIIIDCYKYHRYLANNRLELLWFHFDGNSARAFYDMLAERGRLFVTIDNGMELSFLFQKMFMMFEQKNEVSELLLSKYITDILTLIGRHPLLPGETDKTLLEDTLSYIYNHIKEPLPLEELASRCSLSPYYFTRVFKKETGYTPHAFIIQTRINQAKYYLRSTNASINAIASQTGFYNASNFCTSFKKVTGTTPQNYRNL